MGKKQPDNAASTSGKKRKVEEKKEWFDIDPKLNNNVYVSGLHESTTEEEFDELMSKCGIVMLDDNGMCVSYLTELISAKHFKCHEND